MENRPIEALPETPAQRTIRLAPPDDEPVTPVDEEAICQAEADTRSPVPLEDLLNEF